MTANSSATQLVRRALRIEQTGKYPMFMFALRADEVLQIADISRVSRDEAGSLIGYQRPEVRRHVAEIIEYLNTDGSLFPNPIILALSSRSRFESSRGPGASDGLATSGRLTIPLPAKGKTKPAWIVDGQQRALALSRTNRSEFPVPVTAFVADSVSLQRDQFLRVNNTRPLPRGLVTELLPEVDSPLPPRLAIRKAPAALCDVLNTEPISPMYGLIKRASTARDQAPHAVITDTVVVNMLNESLTSPSGCLFPYRDVSRNETDFDGILQALFIYWSAVRDTFPDAWGKPASKSRLMHGAGIRAMGRLMDRILGVVDPRGPNASETVRQHLALIAPYCRWTGGQWDELNMQWNEIENMHRHIQELSSYLIRVHRNSRAELA
ncbi:DGQHR domain-containing protein DpdB [Micromonospora cathayae]|uniref:DGQHR domain-containing protein DpdB n=1 Tax=Micromonospora cathayae TaxID=3028804 RepID=A0ABY7ZQJ9_9ACTN|nr:DGQHR domain-containing protein DpdB [Micromonospora sp. HUAS 3]WDZ84701.1 DGQHR domain-containing protein DpdB [Micromonospora sp. HUAS 3]